MAPGTRTSPKAPRLPRKALVGLAIASTPLPHPVYPAAYAAGFGRRPEALRFGTVASPAAHILFPLEMLPSCDEVDRVVAYSENLIG